MVVISDQWSMTWATDPTVISDPGENVTGHRWAKLGPQMGHKAKRRPCGRRSTTLSVEYGVRCPTFPAPGVRVPALCPSVANSIPASAVRIRKIPATGVRFRRER